MQAGNTRLEELYTKWINNTATPDEMEELLKLMQEGASREQLMPGIEKFWTGLEDDHSFSSRQKDRLVDNILSQWPSEPVIRIRRRIPYWRWVAAAVVILLTGVAIWQFTNKDTTELVQKTVAPVPEVIAPGRNGAILTLSDGRQILLDSTNNGVFATQGKTEIAIQNNQLIYQAGDDMDSATITYNTMSTPKGRQFQLLLPDGSRVWLNAASSIRYPVAFRGTERKVEVKGEAYFEVAADQARPFLVQTQHQVVQALGTGFNVHAYSNETAEQTTLVEGSVKVTLSTGKQLYAILGPGQQAMLDNRKQSMAVLENQSEAATAWKNGYFHLENMSFEKVMKQLERWYDIEVVYANGVPDLSFYGGISRNMTLDALIRALKVSEVHFKIQAGRRLVVYK
ncbi:MAG: FecR domain-containing protein [Pseudobacter sp.]|uniref:FecR domain-containing protein n=1 Tax=Pseudobacter sp. TaxID=2045420 RepID=UPI003F7E1788